MKLMWVRRISSNARFHLPNSKGKRAVCSFLLPPTDQQEAMIDPPVAKRCKTCHREYERILNQEELAITYDKIIVAKQHLRRERETTRDEYQASEES